MSAILPSIAFARYSFVLRSSSPLFHSLPASRRTDTCPSSTNLRTTPRTALSLANPHSLLHPSGRRNILAAAAAAAHSSSLLGDCNSLADIRPAAVGASSRPVVAAVQGCRRCCTLGRRIRLQRRAVDMLGLADMDRHLGDTLVVLLAVVRMPLFETKERKEMWRREKADKLGM